MPLVVGRKYEDSPALSARSYQTHRLKLWFKRGKLFYIEYSIRLFLFLLKNRADIYVANDLDTLLPNFIISKWYNARLIYDTHEFFTEVPELVHRPFTRKLWLSLEQLLFPRLKNIITVNDCIAQAYHERYGKQLTVIHNMPKRNPIVSSLKTITSDTMPVILYQGAINIGRGVELMLDAAELLPNTIWWILGNGDEYNRLYEKLQAKPNLVKRVNMPGAIPFEKLSDFTTQAHIGLSIEADTGLNYRYATPNKIFDYIQQGVPVIVSNLPAMRKLVEKYDVGIVLESYNAECLAKTIQSLLNNSILYAQLQKNALAAADLLCWENEEQKLRLLYS